MDHFQIWQPITHATHMKVHWISQWTKSLSMAKDLWQDWRLKVKILETPYCCDFFLFWLLWPHSQYQKPQIGEIKWGWNNPKPMKEVFIRRPYMVAMIFEVIGGQWEVLITYEGQVCRCTFKSLNLMSCHPILTAFHWQTSILPTPIPWLVHSTISWLWKSMRTYQHHIALRNVDVLETILQYTCLSYFLHKCNLWTNSQVNL